MIGRKSDRIKAIQSNTEPKAISPHGIDLRCSNCQERSYFTELDQDPNNVFCTNCGHLTPIRQLKRLRGIQGPAIQQNTTIVTPPADKAKGSRRKPQSMINKPVDPAIQAYANRGGITIIDSQTNSIL